MRMSLPDVTPPSAVAASVELEIDSELQPGTAVGEYIIESKLGQGGMASVYAGVQPVIGKKVAVKVMSRQLCLDPVQVERGFRRAEEIFRDRELVFWLAVVELEHGEWLAGVGRQEEASPLLAESSEIFEQLVAILLAAILQQGSF